MERTNAAITAADALLVLLRFVKAGDMDYFTDCLYELKRSFDIMACEKCGEEHVPKYSRVCDTCLACVGEDPDEARETAWLENQRENLKGVK